MVPEGSEDCPSVACWGVNDKGHGAETTFPGRLLRGALFLEPAPTLWVAVAVRTQAYRPPGHPGHP